MNTLYDTPDGALARQGKLLRIRVERPATAANRLGEGAARAPGQPSGIAHLQGPGSTGALEQDPAAAAGTRFARSGRFVLPTGRAGAHPGGLGLRPSFRYEKYRSTYRLPGLAGVTLELDETPIGDFLEAEGSRSGDRPRRGAARLSAGRLHHQELRRLFLDETRRSGQPVIPGGAAGTSRTGSRDMLFPRNR